jgi:hypothetical protein
MYAYAPGVSGLQGGLIRGGRTVQSLEGPATVNGDDVFYLASLTDANGNPTPGGQLESVKETTESGGITTTVETVGHGLVQRGGFKRRVKGPRGWYTKNEGGKWALDKPVASRTYSHAKFAPREDRDRVKTAAPWTRPDGTVANIWSMLVLSSEAKALGFALPKVHLRNNHFAGSRGVGHEHGGVRPAQRAADRASERAVENVDDGFAPIGSVL